MGGLDRMVDRRSVGESPTGVEEADEFLKKNADGLLYGALFDQQMRAELAFAGAYRLHKRLGHLEARRIAEMDPDEFSELFRKPPSIHRFGGMMAARTQKLAASIAEQGGAIAIFWRDDPTDDELIARFRRLPGFGESKARTLFHALELFGHRSPGSPP